MKLKLSQIINAAGTLTKLGAEKLPARIAYRVHRNIKLLQSELDTFNQASSALIKEYGVDDGSGNFKVLPENAEKYAKEITELLQEEIELDIQLLTLNELSCGISAFDIMTIDWMIKE